MSKTWYSSADEIDALGERLLAQRLPKREWTHAGHFAAALWLLRTRGFDATARDMPDIIRAHNLSVGGANTDTEGYHETITQASIRAARSVLDAHAPDAPLHKVANALMNGEFGASSWPLWYWSQPVLFSVEARRAWVEPDVKPLPF